jgi:chromosome segregation ATPase
MLDKHRDLYRRRLPRLLTAQHEVSLVQAELAGAAGERDRLRAERDGILAERDGIVAQRNDLAGRLEETERRLAVAQVAEGERGRLADERDRLYAELESWHRRVARMEGTRAWRLREWVLGLRRLWRF